jgi:hypothetical protein
MRAGAGSAIAVGSGHVIKPRGDVPGESKQRRCGCCARLPITDLQLTLYLATALTKPGTSLKGAEADMALQSVLSFWKRRTFNGRR